MAKIKIYSLEGKETSEKEIPSGLFETKVSKHLLHEVVRAEERALRQGTADTKTRSDVRGGGKKPWKQKGTGRARHGSTRSPIWRKGGTVFGPHPRDYTVKLNRKEKQLALSGALSTRYSEERIIGINTNGIDSPKTKKFVEFLRNFEGIRKPLFVHTKEEKSVAKSVRNIEDASHINLQNMSTRKILLSDFVIFTASAVDALAKNVSSVEVEK